MLEWIRFILFTLLLFAGIGFEIVSVIGVNRFRFSLNRLHAASIGDTMGLTCIVLACMLKAGISLLSLKFLLVLVFMMCTSPMSGHLISLLVYRTDPAIDKEAHIWRT